jgi:hypothetical protein
MGTEHVASAREYASDLCFALHSSVMYEVVIVLVELASLKVIFDYAHVGRCRDPHRKWIDFYVNNLVDNCLNAYSMLKWQHRHASLV